MQHLVITRMIGIWLMMLLSACGSGDSGQNMPIGGTPFNGPFTPGIWNLITNGNACNSNGPETLWFVVQESTTYFYDNNVGAGQQAIIAGSFANGGQNINQTNPCFTGSVLLSNCGAAAGGTIEFNGCSVSFLGSTYQFLASYILYSVQGFVITSGTINANK